MQYTLTQKFKCKEPFTLQDGTHEECSHTIDESYSTSGKALCKSILRDVLDAPAAELTLEQVYEDFRCADPMLSEAQAVKILDYYNGRLALLSRALSDLDAHDDAKPFELEYDIPAKYCTMYDDGAIPKYESCSIKIKAR